MGIRSGKRRLSSAPTGRTDVILENIGDGVFATDLRGRIHLWNQAAERITGLRCRDVKGAPCKGVLRLTHDGEPVDCSRGCPFIDVSGKRLPDPVVVEVTHHGRGRSRPLLMTVSGVRSDGQPAEVIHSFRDISGIEKSEEAKTMFLATTSHELKTPLTVILGYAQGLRAGIVDEDHQDAALETIESRARELGRIVDRLLITGRIDSGRIDLALGPVHIGEVMCERSTSFGEATGREISTFVPDDLPMVVADLDALSTVLDHLLENAVKYSPDGGPIGLLARAVNGSVEVRVSDTGLGMSASELDHCFDRFWQAESDDVRRFGGTGIGLYIVKALVRAMGGGVHVRSQPGEGSAFTVVLRRAHRDFSEPAQRLAEPDRTVAERSIVREFMRQIGVPPGGAA